MKKPWSPFHPIAKGCGIEDVANNPVKENYIYGFCGYCRAAGIKTRIEYCLSAKWYWSVRRIGISPHPCLFTGEDRRALVFFTKKAAVEWKKKKRGKFKIVRICVQEEASTKEKIQKEIIEYCKHERKKLT